MWGKFPNWGGGSDPNPLLDVYLPSYFWHAKMAPNQSCMPLVVKKNGNMWETFPTEGGGHLFPTQFTFTTQKLCFFGEDHKCS